MKYVAVARNTQTNDADLRSLQNLLRKLLQGQNNHLARRHFNQRFLWGKVCPCTNSFSSLQIFQSGVSTSFDRLSMFFWFVCFPCLLDRAQQHPVVFQVSTKVHRAPKTGRFTKRKICASIVSCGKILRRFMDCVPTATLGQVDFGLWGNSWPSIMENTTILCTPLHCGLPYLLDHRHKLSQACSLLMQMREHKLEHIPHTSYSQKNINIHKRTHTGPAK